MMNVKDINDYVKQYLNWKQENRAEIEERIKRVQWYQEKLGSPEKIKNLSLEDFQKLIKSLWALKLWKNPDFKVNKLIEDNGFEKLKSEFISFLFSDAPIEKRWDEFKNSIKGLGSASISEILTYIFPNRYGILNSVSLTMLLRFGFLTEKDVKKMSFGLASGHDYRKFMEGLTQFREKLESKGLANADFLEVDFYIYYLFTDVFNLGHHAGKPAIIEEALGVQESLEKPPVQIKEEIVPEKITTHQEAEYILLKSGQLLGYDTYTPDKGKEAYGQKLDDLVSLTEIPQFVLAPPFDAIKNIDVVWIDEEFHVCCFEVEHTTDFIKGLLRLYHVSPLNAKLFITAPAESYPKFEKEVNKMPFKKIKHRYIFKSYEELMEFYHLAEKFIDLKRKFFKED
jgi:endonuclease III-like uncharacterized protein